VKVVSCLEQSFGLDVSQCVREGLKVVSCLEQSFGLDVSDGLVCMWLVKG